MQVPVDLPSAIAAINQLKLLIQMISGQQQVTGPAGKNGAAGVAIPGGAGGLSLVIPAGQDGQKGKDAKDPKGGRFVEDRSQRVVQEKRIFQDNDKTSPNYVDIAQINHCVWVDKVTGETITWSR